MKANESFRQLRSELDTLPRAPITGLCELGVFVAATVAGIAILLGTDHVLWELLALWLITAGGMGVSTNAHTASHNAVSDRRWINKAMTYFGYPFFLQVSATYWHQKHLVTHHPHPNVVGVDKDAELMPLFAISERDMGNLGPVQRRLIRLQWMYFPIVLVGNAFNVVRRGWIFLARNLLDAERRRPDHWIDLFALLGHYLVWIAIPMLFLPVADVIAFTVLRFALMSYAMFALFAPAHFPAEAAMVDADAIGDDIVALQTVTTVNFRTGYLGSLLCGGVQYQIEHHLFPSVNPAHYPALSDRVRAYCESHGYPYRTLGWGEAIWKSLVVFARPKPVMSSCKRTASGSAHPSG